MRSLLTRELGEGGLIQTRRLLDKSPGAMRLTYFDGTTYQPATVEARIDDGDRNFILDLNLPLVLTETRAETVAGFLLGEARIADDAAIGVSLADIAVEVGDGVQVDDGRIWRVDEIVEASGRHLSLSAERDSLKIVRASETQASIDLAAGFAEPGLLMIDAPALPDSLGDARPLVVGSGTPWPGPVTVSAGVDISMLRARSELVEPAGVGQLTAPLASGPLGRWDEASEFVLEMPGEVFASQTAIAALAGENAVLVQNKSGWELICYRNAELIGNHLYRLTGLLRGLQGSVIEAVSESAVCVRLDQRLQRANLAAHEVGTGLFWQASGRGLTNEADQVLFEKKAGLAFSPAHLRAKYLPGGDVTLTWVHRGAEISDSLILPEVENAGRFRARLIRNGATVLEADVDVPIWQLQDGWQAGDLVSIREYGADNRAGRAAELIL